jgi:predicted HicB family RNase H-like nuclease
MTEEQDRARRRAIVAEYAEEEAEAAEAEIAEKNPALEVPLNLRIAKDLDRHLRRRAAAEQIPTSALVRRLLRQAIHEVQPVGLTADQVETIARQVAREELHRDVS